MQGRQRRYPRLLLLFVLSVFLVYTWATIGSQQSVAFAHAFVIGSDPVDGSTVNTAPAVVRIFFDTTISPASIAHVFAPDGSIVDARRSSISPTNSQELDTPLSTPRLLPQGGYTVRWTALSNGDGHTTHGVIGFNIGHSSTGLQGQTILGPSTSNILPELNLIGILAVAWEWLVLMALTFWVGILITEGLILAGGGERMSSGTQWSRHSDAGGGERTSALLVRTRKQAQPLQWLCLVGLLVGEIITLILRATQLTQTSGGSGIDFDAIRQIVFETNYGYLWLARIALILIALGLLWWTTRQKSSTSLTISSRRYRNRFSRLRQQVAQESGSTKELSAAAEAGVEGAINRAPTAKRYIIGALILAGLILCTLALSSDAAQLAQPRISAILLDWLYLAAQCIWLGGLTYLGYVLLPLLPTAEPDHYAETLLTVLRRFTPLALATIAVLLVSGFFLSEVSLSNAQQLITDPYGRTLLVKSIFIAIMLALSFYALFFLRPKLTRQAALLPVVDAELPARRARQSALEQTERNLKRALSISSWMGAGVLLCVALMAFFAPPIVFPATTYTLSISTTSPSTTGLNTQTKKVGNLSVTLLVLPGRVDYANTIIITMADSNGNPVTDAQVQISINMELMDMGTAHKVVNGGNPTYIAIFDKDSAFSMVGIWDVTVGIQRPGQAAVQATFQVMLAG